MKTMKEKMIRVIDILIEEMEEIHAKKDKRLVEVEVLNKLANAIVNITGYAVIEKKMTEEELLKELEKIREQRGGTEKDAS